MNRMFLLFAVAGLGLGAVASEDARVKVVRELVAKTFLPRNAGATTFTSVFNELEAADAAADAAWRRLKSKAEYEAYRKRLHARYVEAVGGFPEKTPLNAKVMGTVVRKDYRVEKVLFESRPGVFVTGLVYLPASAAFKPPYGAFLVVCGHSGDGKGELDYQRACVQGALAGLASFIIDPIGQGERLQVPEVGNTTGHNLFGVNAMLVGQSMAGYRLWDAMRALDYLEMRPDIRHDGFGVMGNSGGGTMSALLEAMDPRITAGAPSCYISSLREVIRHAGPQDAEQNVFGQLAFGLNHAGYVLMGGNAVRIHCCHNDFFPFYGATETMRTVRETVANCGLGEDRYGMTDVPGPHGWKESTRESSVLWMRRWLNGETSALPIDILSCRAKDIGFNIFTSDYGLRPPKEDKRENFNVTPEGSVAKLPGFRSVYDCLRDELDKALASRRPRTADETAAVVRRRAGIRPLKEVGAIEKEHSRETADGMSVLRSVFVFPEGLNLPAVVLTPSAVTREPVLLVGDGLRESRAEIARAYLDLGHPVMLADLLATGEIGHVWHRFYGMDNDDEEPAVMLYLLGKSLVGVRAEEILSLADSLRRRFSRPVRLVATGRVSIAAAHAFAAEPAAFAGVEAFSPPPSWTDYVRSSRWPCPYANAVQGALLDYDWTDLLKDASPEKPVVCDPLGLQAKIDAATAQGGGRVTVPKGTWQTGKIHLKSGVELHFEDGATLVFSDNPRAYLPAVKTSWQGTECWNYSPLVYASGATNVAITGKGRMICPSDKWLTWESKDLAPVRWLARNGMAAWDRANVPVDDRRATDNTFIRLRPQFLQFTRCGHVRLEDFSIRGTPFWTIHLFCTDDVTARGLDVSAFDENGRALMNSDGIDIECSKRVTLEGCTFRQNDDAIVIKAGRDGDGRRLNRASEDVVIRNCRVLAGHALLAIGSELAGGIRNVRLSDCTVEGKVGCALFVKTNAKRGGFVENVTVENVTAKCANAVVDLCCNYWYTPGPKAKNLRRTPVRNIVARNIHCEDAGDLVRLIGDPALPAENFTIENVRSDKRWGREFYAVNVKNVTVDGRRCDVKLGVTDVPKVGGQEAD